MPSKTKISKLVKRYQKKFERAENEVDRYRRQWQTFESELRSIFRVLKEKHNRNEFYSNLFIQDDEYLVKQKVHNRKHIAIRFGLKPLRISTVEYDRLTNKPKSFSQEIEDGGALFFSQGVKGEVLVYLISAKNDLIKRSNQVLMLKIYTNPNRIKEKHILKHISQFFWFSLVTSYMSNISSLDKFYIYLYKLRSRSLKVNWSVVLPALILIVSVIHLILFIIYITN